MNNTQRDIIKTMEPFVEDQLSLLKPVSESWQPADLLPNMTQEDWTSTLQECRHRSESLSDETLVVLVGNMITEEALPTYQTLLNRPPEFADATGEDDTPWARWTRGWTAEENRHGEILGRYLYLTGRVDMRSVEITIQHLLRNGFDPLAGQDPYKGLIYTSFQERATKISHGNVSRLAKESGDSLLERICSLVMGDEARHEEAYKRFVRKIIELDPSEGLLAFATMMKRMIAMPGKNMTDGNDPDLFSHFAVAAQRIGVYTANDYASIIEHLVGFWKISELSGLTSEAEEAQDHLCGLAQRYSKLADRAQAGLARQPKMPVSWIFGRSV